MPASMCLFMLRSACGTNNARYPVGWPTLSAASLAGGCSDVTGKHMFDRNDPDYDATTFGVLWTFLGGGVTQVDGAPYVSFSIAGDAAKSLTITFARAPSSSTSASKVTDTQAVTALNGSASTLLVTVTARGQVTRTIESLNEDNAFTDVQDHGIIASGGQQDLATISLKRR